jgi:hypothetical protein
MWTRKAFTRRRRAFPAVSKVMIDFNIMHTTFHMATLCCNCEAVAGVKAPLRGRLHVYEYAYNFMHNFMQAR